MSFNKLFTFIFLITINKSLLKEESNEKLLFVWEHFRHGARGSYKSFDYKNWVDMIKEEWRGSGELTPLGMRMLYLLGVSCRNKYKDLLSSDFNPNEIFIMSTDVNRTLISAYSFLQGIYSNSKKNNNINNKQIKRAIIQNRNYSKQINNKIIILKNKSIEDGINAFPVHIYSTKDYKYQLYRAEYCPGIGKNYTKIRNSEGIQKIYNDIFRTTNENFGKYIFKFMNKSIKDEPDYLYNYKTIKNLGDTFIADYFDGRNLTIIKNSGINIDKFYNHCLNISLITSYYNYYGNPLEKIVEFGVSPIFRDIFNYMDKRILLDKKGTPDKIISSSPKLFVVSGHDVSLAGIDLFLESKFGIPFRRADYSSNQIFELWKNKKDGKYYIKYLINLEIAGNFEYNEFKKKVFSYLYSDEEIKQVCKAYYSIYMKTEPTIFFLNMFIILIFLSFIILLYLIKMKKNIKRKEIRKENIIAEMREMPLVYDE